MMACYVNDLFKNALKWRSGLNIHTNILDIDFIVLITSKLKFFHGGEGSLLS